MNLWIKNGHLLDPANGRDEICDIWIQDGKVAILGSLSSDKQAEVTGENTRIIDAAGKYVMPGFLDLHVHLREPGFEYKETIKTGTAAAAKGGFTAVCPMPNTSPATDSPEMIQKVLAIAERDSKIHVYPVGAVTKGQAGEEMTDISGMVKAGAKAISEDGKSVMDAELYRNAMKEAKKAGIPVLAHCEDKNMVGKGAMNAGKKAEELGIQGITNAVEDVIVARDILLAKETGARLHLCHCSTKDSVAMIELAKKDGVEVSGEVCPHHFSMTEEEIPADDANYKMNPPLRSSTDVETLRRGLSEGIMEAISTDHAPHGEEEKKKSIAEAPFGIVGSETAYALAVTYLVRKGYLTPMQLVERMSTNPCRILGVPGGNLAVGMPADITIADMDSEYVIDKNTFVSKGKNTPFHGVKVQGRVHYTMVDGEVVYEYKE
ncbi:MAG: dihydroorotase [Lachnospiraceae bacterium]|nr:dihydroorotase [Lachnospiraceae bacterium]